MRFGDYIIYVDESGDPNLQSVFQSYPLFVLAFCIFNKEHYVQFVSPEFQRFKFKWFGHDSVVFHEREIRQQTPPFKFLQNEMRKDAFLNELSELMNKIEFTVIAGVIDKAALLRRYAKPGNPYELAMQFCMERLHKHLENLGQAGQTTHCVFEKRGKKEDTELELEFRRICDGGNFAEVKMPDYEILFVDKSANLIGLQISDLIARPIGLSILKPEQSNRTIDIIQQKIRKSPSGQTIGWGLKVFP